MTFHLAAAAAAVDVRSRRVQGKCSDAEYRLMLADLPRGRKREWDDLHETRCSLNPTRTIRNKLSERNLAKKRKWIRVGQTKSVRSS